jgi:hypothetical protein
MFKRTPKELKKNDERDRIYELACVCTVAHFKKAQALKMIEKMFKCKECKRPVFLVAEIEKSD